MRSQMLFELNLKKENKKKTAYTFLAFDIDNPKIDNIEARE